MKNIKLFLVITFTGAVTIRAGFTSSQYVSPHEKTFLHKLHSSKTNIFHEDQEDISTVCLTNESTYIPVVTLDNAESTIPNSQMYSQISSPTFAENGSSQNVELEKFDDSKLHDESSVTISTEDRRDDNNSGDDDDHNDKNPDNHNESIQVLRESTTNTISDHVEESVTVSNVESESVRLRRLWKEQIEVCPSEHELRKSITVHHHNITSILTNPLRVNGTDRASFQRQVLAQFLNPLTRSDHRAIWLDPEFALFLRGQVAIAQTSSDIRKNDLCRGLKLLSNTGSAIIIKSVVRALSFSLHSDLVFLNRKSVDNVRRLANKRYAIPLSSLTAERLFTELFGVLHSTGKKYVVCLYDEYDWYLRVPGLTHVLVQELSKVKSKLFFLHAEPDPPISSEYTTSAPAYKNVNRQDAPTVTQPTGETNSNLPSFSSPLPPSPFQSFPPPQSSATPPSQATMQHSSQPFPPNGANLPPPVGQSFQITIKNGSASITPIPSLFPPGVIPTPGMLPPGMVMGTGMFPGGMFPPPGMFPPGMLPPSMGRMPPGGVMMPSPPESLIRMIMEHHHEQNGAPITDEDMKRFMNDPTHQAAMKEFLDSVMKMASSKLPPGALDNTNEPVDVKVHMMSVPVPVNFMPQAPQPTTGYNLQPTTPSPKENSPTTTTTKLGSKLKFPGMFFRGRNEKSSDKATQETDSADKDHETIHDSDEEKHDTESSTPSTSVPSGSSSDLSDEDVPIATGHIKLPSPEQIALDKEAFAELLPEATLRGPKEHMLKQLWDRMSEEEITKKILKLNRRALEKECRRKGVPLKDLSTAHHTDSNHTDTRDGVRKSIIYSSSLNSLLSRKVLHKDELLQAIYSARLFQAGLGGGGCGGSSKDSSYQTIGLWALDAGLCSALGLPIPRLGRMPSRPVDELFASITDKHERALLPNVITPADVGVSYDMIGGLDDVKKSLQQCITYPLKYPRLYAEGIAAEGVKGVLLFGPPGTGKTMLAKAVATEGGATFLSVDASTIENKWLGESEKNARAVFTLARKLAPCVIYLDEVDSLLSSREGTDESSHGTLTSVKTTLMQEWDGLRTTKDRVVVIASTNRPFDLDEAVLRRLPRRILVDLPDLRTREEILAVTLLGNRLAPDVNLTLIATQLEGYTGSDVKEVCREAVVNVSHERAAEEEGYTMGTSHNTSTHLGTESDHPTISHPEVAPHSPDVETPLRPVCMADFTKAMKKLKASVDETGRETSKVIEWNERYGEIKKRKTKSRNMSMYI